LPVKRARRSTSAGKSRGIFLTLVQSLALVGAVVNGRQNVDRSDRFVQRPSWSALKTAGAKR
jgi:hypothetical protein